MAKQGMDGMGWEGERVEWSWRMWELSRIKRQPLISDIPKGEIGSAQQRKRERGGNAACSGEREIDGVVVSTNILL